MEANRSSLWAGANLRAIFVSYRRLDTEGESGRLFDDLVSRFGERSVFMDVAAIQVGRDFRKAIEESVAECGVLLAMIGPGWLDATSDKGERRLEDPNDLVRMEIAAALNRDIAMIPVRVRGAKMPSADQLPNDLRDLAYRNSVELTHVRWKSDVQVLLTALQALLRRSGDEQISGGVALTLSEANGVLASARPASSVGHAATLPGTPAVEVPCDSPITFEAAEGVTRELARYIGPIAEIVVKRAAKQCSTVAELRRTVANEIEAKADRTRFLDACES